MATTEDPTKDPTLSPTTDPRRTSIFSDPLDSDLTEWNGTIDAGTATIVTSVKCPTNSNCLQLDSSGWVRTDSYHPTTGYTDVEVTFDLRSDIDAICVCWAYTIIIPSIYNAYQSLDESTTIIIPLPSEFEDSDDGVKFGCQNQGSGSCWISNAALTGIPMTDNPTMMPTMSPTSAPNLFPTSDPTPSPTVDPRRSAIYFDAFDTSLSADWMHYSLTEVIVDSAECPTGSTCLALPYDDWIQSAYIVTTGYSDIEMTFNLRAESGSTCYYSAEADDGTVVGETYVSVNDESITIIYPLPSQYADSAVKMKLANHGAAGYCYFSHLSLTGIPITDSPTTMSPSPVPTGSPTTSQRKDIAATVTPTNYSIDDIEIQFGTDFTYNISHWLLDSSLNSPDDWAVTLTLSGDYTFQSSVHTVTVEISGFCRVVQCDMFLGFGSSDKYITFLTDFDGGVRTNMDVSASETKGSSIYPACGGALGVGSLSEILNGSSDLHEDAGQSDIRVALAGGNVSDWYLLTSDPNDETWPITLNITNDVASNQVTFSFVSDTLNLECIYNDTFPLDEDVILGLQSDINGVDEINDDIFIEYISVQSS